MAAHLDQPDTSTGTDRVKSGMAEQLKGGVIMDVVTPEQAKIAEDAGAIACRGQHIERWLLPRKDFPEGR